MSADASNITGNSQQQWTVRRILEWTTAHLEKHGSESPRLDTEILLAHARHCRRIDLYTRFDEPLSDVERATMRELVLRRARAEPVAYLVGHREFFSLEFRVTSDVLIPRPETETLVMEVLNAIAEISAPHVADIGTGSGCISVTTAARNSRAEVTAVDISEEALNVARDNAERHGVLERVHFRQGDLFSPLPAEARYDVIVSNPPYICEEEMATLQADVRLHEPPLALLAGVDGLAVIRRLIAGAPERLKPGGALLMEIAPEQAAAVCDLLEAEGKFIDLNVVKDLTGLARVVGARFCADQS